MCTFILAFLARDFPKGQIACCKKMSSMLASNFLDEADFLLRQWSCLCIARMSCLSDQGKMNAAERGTQDRLVNMMSDDSAEWVKSGNGREQEEVGSGGMYDRDERAHVRLEVAVVTVEASPPLVPSNYISPNHPDIRHDTRDGKSRMSSGEIITITHISHSNEAWTSVPRPSLKQTEGRTNWVIQDRQSAYTEFCVRTVML
ncbi:hypothetical protein FB446DRAFT_707881 [Lentinula raphanica]|nr:hypothetical protein FB446DRAFT_707881 [Lentinula raphanica]KAJ3816686.1 hypothetical protein F5880DRAFT_1512440 [Lentinula raphanica]